MTQLATRLLHADRYSGWHRLGSGGSADVFKVFDRDLGIDLAVKILKPALCADQTQVDALRREVLISRALRHPNICPIHDLYEGPQGIGIIMDYLGGSDLKGWIESSRGRLLDTLPDRLNALRRIAEALGVAHTRIIHRDLKPANIFVADNDVSRPMIMDFGLSVLGVATDGRFVGGTPKYMAPEQYAAPERVDQRSDLFSFGILAYELLTDGRIPESSMRDVMRTRAVPDIGRSGVTPPSRYCSAIPADLDRLILQLVQIDRDSRPPSARDVCDRLGDVVLRDAFSSQPEAATASRDTVTVPAGTYIVGSRKSGATMLERPQRTVKVSEFAVAACVVTNREYRAFLAATGYRHPDLMSDPRFGADDAPVVAVTWDDAQAYAAWAGGRLPTEIEWEIAGKSGAAELDYPWGEEVPSPTRANIDRVCETTTPVRSYPAGRNAWGLWDICGNVWEWCADGWDEQLFRRMKDGAENPIGRSDGPLRPLRGGSFDSFVETGRCGFRSKAPRSEMRADIGFRIVFPAGGAGAHDR